MSTPKNDGGPAFPVTADHFDKNLHPSWHGMTLRDWFAGQALAGLLARDLQPNRLDNSHINHAHVRSDDSDRMPTLAYQYADAMLKAREGKR